MHAYWVIIAYLSQKMLDFSLTTYIQEATKEVNHVSQGKITCIPYQNDTETALYTRTASPSLAWTLTSITTTTVLSFHKSVLSATVSTTHFARAGAARGKEEHKKWRRCRSHRSRKLRLRCMRGWWNHHILPPVTECYQKIWQKEKKWEWHHMDRIVKKRKRRDQGERVIEVSSKKFKRSS